jgi:RNA polymerase sigma factor (TIGR02999 family)
MDVEHQDDLSVLIEQARAGSGEATNLLLQAVYDELHRIAERLMRRERAGHTLGPSALVDEAVIRLIKGKAFDRIESRGTLLGLATLVMRHILVDHARKRGLKGMVRVPLMDDILTIFERRHLDVIALNEALDQLSVLNKRQCEVIELRFFAGLSMPEVAASLKVGLGTVERDWRFARAWLRTQLEGTA